MDEIVITTEEENERAIQELYELDTKEKHTDAELGYMERLTAAIEKFEEEHYPISEPDERTKMLISDALGHDPEKARKAMAELNWHDAEDTK
jgi:hypothetical protein